MTLPLERARSRKPVTWLTLLGVLLLPVVIGGILVAALYNPTDRLEAMDVAIVNNDEPVTVNGQLAPLGRQLTAGLVEGSDAEPSNLTWTISNTDDAAEGLDDGTYAAVITIPKNFSAAATSTAPGSTPEKATISVQSSPDSLIVDDAITAQVTQAAASLMGEQLSEVYLENVFLGFTSLGDQLGDAANGATTLANGAGSLTDGAVQLADGAHRAADGAAQLPGGATALANGASGISDGAGQLASGLDTLASGTTQAADGANALAAGVRARAAQLQNTGIVPQDLLDLASGSAATAAASAGQVGALDATLGSLAGRCAAVSTDAQFCTDLAAAAAAAGTAATTAEGAAKQAGYTSGRLSKLATDAPKELAGQLTTLADNVDTLGSNLGTIAGGVGQSAAGARELGSGATQLASGATTLAGGASALADGVGQVASGSDELASGASDLTAGTEQLASGLHTAVESIPSYTDAEARTLASVVADPVTASGIGANLFGASAIPLLATLALWFGGLASFVALRAVSAHALTSRRPSALLALGSLAPAAGIGALQGLFVAGVVQIASDYDWSTWAAFALLCMAAGVAFAAINQALVAVFGGAGRWIAALVGALAMATGVVSTVPAILTSIASLMPTSPAYHALLGALTPAGGVGAALVGLMVWAVIAFLVTTIAVTRRRSTSARAVLTSSLAPA